MEILDSDDQTPVSQPELTKQMTRAPTESQSQSTRLPKHIEAINQSIIQKTRNLDKIETL